jgi:hypothetical protein
MSHPPAYDAFDTVRWMLDAARAELAAETYVTPEGRARRKTKAQRHDDRVRFETLCEVIWNVSGRREPLDDLTARETAAA